MTQKAFLALLVLTATTGAPVLAADNPSAPRSSIHYDDSTLSQPKYKVVVEANVRIRMRDGVTLAADVFRPDAPGHFPAILARTPYGRASAGSWEEARWFAERGYVFVSEDTRGRYDSDGHFYAFKNEADDGYDTDEWFGQQPWFDGNLGTIGGSYGGYVQWAQAVRGSKYLKAMAPDVTSPDVYGNWIYIDGALHYGFALPWGGIDIDGHVDQFAGGPVYAEAGFPWESAYSHLPVATADEAGLHRTPHYRDWLAHPTRDHYWDGISYEHDYDKIGVPILSVDGWYDIFLRGALQDDVQVRKVGKTAEARNGKRLVIGPWAHSTGMRVALVNGRAGGAPADPMDFGDDAVVDFNKVYLRWFDHWLKKVDNGVDSDAPVEIFVMGENHWRSEQEWPLARTHYTNYYIHSGGKANSVNGDGVLSAAAPKSEAMDKFSYDPAHPVPSMGGNLCCSNVPAGPWDQRPVERRDDVPGLRHPRDERAHGDHRPHFHGVVRRDFRGGHGLDREAGGRPSGRLCPERPIRHCPRSLSRGCGDGGEDDRARQDLSLHHQYVGYQPRGAARSPLATGALQQRLPALRPKSEHRGANRHRDADGRGQADHLS